MIILITGAAGNLGGLLARTRLEEERLLFDRTPMSATTPVVLRLGMIYGPD